MQAACSAHCVLAGKRHACRASRRGEWHVRVCCRTSGQVHATLGHSDKPPRPPAAAAIDSESLPPSTATSSSSMASRRATAASYMAAPSLSILAAYIQLTAGEGDKRKCWVVVRNW